MTAARSGPQAAASRAHSGTQLWIYRSLVAVALAILGWYVREDRATLYSHAHERAAHDVVQDARVAAQDAELRLVAADVRRVREDLAELKAGQRELLRYARAR